MAQFVELSWPAAGEPLFVHFHELSSIGEDPADQALAEPDRFELTTQDDLVDLAQLRHREGGAKKREGDHRAIKHDPQLIEGRLQDLQMVTDHAE
jgi:hypothetical protein